MTLNNQNEYFKKKHYKESKESVTLEECIDALSKIVKTFLPQPTVIDRNWLRINAGTVYEKIRGILPRRNGQINWDFFASNLPEDLRKLWKDTEGYRGRDRNELYTLEGCITAFVKIVESINPPPTELSPAWMGENATHIYEKLLGLLPKKDKHRDWSFFKSKLPEHLQKIWHYRASYLDLELYSNKNELNESLGQYKDKLYLLSYYSHLTTEVEKNTAKSIVNELTMLAQKGNAAAVEILEKDLRHLCNEWIEKYTDFAPWKQAGDKLEKLIKGVIFNYAPESNTNFFGYLLGSMRKAVQFLPKTKEYDDNKKH